MEELSRLTDRTISLRPFKLEDAKEHISGEDAEQINWLSGGKSTLEGVQDWIKKNQQYWENDGPIFNFAIVNADNKLVGMIEANSSYEEIEGLQKGDVNISYGLYPSARGKGYASRAVDLMISFLRQKGFQRAVIRVDPNNKDSLKVPQRTGFSHQGKIEVDKAKELEVFVKNLG